MERAIEEMLNECQTRAMEDSKGKEQYKLGDERRAARGLCACRARQGRRRNPPSQRRGGSNPQVWTVDSATSLAAQFFRTAQGRGMAPPSLHVNRPRDWTLNRAVRSRFRQSLKSKDDGREHCRSPVTKKMARGVSWVQHCRSPWKCCRRPRVAGSPRRGSFPSRWCFEECPGLEVVVRGLNRPLWCWE